MTLIVRGPPDKIQVLMTGLEDRGRQNPAVTVIETTIGAARQSFGATIIGDQSDALPMIGETRTNTLIRATATPPSIHLLEIAITGTWSQRQQSSRPRSTSTRSVIGLQQALQVSLV